MLSFAIPFVALVAVLAPVRAQVPEYGQCGGIGYSGSTPCASGTVCSSVNAYYYQCLAGAATSPGGGASPTTMKTTAASPTTPVASPTTTGATGSSGSAVGYASNPFAGKQIYANPYYSSEIHSLAIPSLTAPYNALATQVAEVGTFFWLDQVAKVPTLGTYLADIQAKNEAGANPPIIGGFVVYDLPDRDCAAAASNGEFSIADNGVANYHNYIDQIVSQTKAYPDVDIVYLVEPDSLANLVTNLNVAKCANAETAYKQCVTYAIQQLNLPNVAMYLDAGHAGWLGWSANIQPAAQLFGSLYAAAGSPSQVRGLATNVANYNGWSLASAPSYISGDSNYDEKLYVNALAPLLQAQGYPAHFITDVGRNGVQPTRQQAWGDWCNVVGTGFGVRPTTDTGDALEDAFVWVKPGGECDGTSDTTAARYDFHCGLTDALQPAPEAGTWFQAYFAQLLQNANPPFAS
ncbi:MAG: hypothetical protein LQ340_001587 [Diploschistes diacapsis]|nr:MAG: hypothetical protein LQ340_001587 [Diploschistes diacapsis]